MRQVFLAALVALGAQAYAQQGELLPPRIRVPGESSVERELTVSPEFLESLGMTADDREAVKNKVKELNTERVALIKQLETDKAALKEAQEKVNSGIAAVGKQKAGLDQYIQERLPGNQRADYPIRVQLQPVIDWLKLSEPQVTDLIAKERQLLASDPRARQEEMARTFLLQRATDKMTPEEHKAHIEQRKTYTTLLKEVAAFHQAWLTNIESVLTDEQKATWRTRYRRTAFPIGLAP